MDIGTSHTYVCPVCGEENEITIDLSAGPKQRYVEDCTVCCCPNSLRIVVEHRSGIISVEAEPES